MRPEIILYEPVGNGQVRLIGADYLVFADAWDKTHSSAPELMGQKFQQFEAPNRFGLPRFYTLHVWAWKENPTGTFVNWHSNISCDAFSGPGRSNRMRSISEVSHGSHTATPDRRSRRLTTGVTLVAAATASSRRRDASSPRPPAGADVPQRERRVAIVGMDDVIATTRSSRRSARTDAAA